MEREPEYDADERLAIALIIGTIFILFSAAGIWSIFFG